MKYLNLLILIFVISATSFGQGKSQGKAKHNEKHNTEIKQKHNTKDYNSDDKVWQKNKTKQQNNSQKGYAKNQPKKVTSAFFRDYPRATHVRWDKNKGDYIATFNNGIWRSTAVYHANGERRDTRTRMTREQLPGNIWDRIFRRDNVTPNQYIVIERPSTAEKIYRILSNDNKAYYYDPNGNRVSYSY